MANKKIEAQRRMIISKLASIANASEEICAEMESVPHERNIARRSLKPKSGMYILHYKPKGFVAEYHDADGREYQIVVKRVDSQ